MKDWKHRICLASQLLALACYLPVVWTIRGVLSFAELTETIWRDRRLHIPNALTLARIVLSPFITAAFLYGVMQPDLVWAWAAIIAFAVVSVFDYLDGYLSRRWGVETPFGAKWDPIADKVLVLPLLPALWFADVLGVVLVVPAVIIGLREPAVDFLRRRVTWVTFPSSPLAKLKTALQMASLGLLMTAHETVMPELWTFGATVFVVASVLTLLTGLDYLARVWGWLDRLIGPSLEFLGVRPT